MEQLQKGVQFVLAAVAAFWYSLPELTQLLIGLMAIDIVLGLILAVKRHDLSAETAWNGMTKKVVSLLLVATASLLSPHIQGIIEINLTQAASAFYLVPELTSITRNAAALDVPVFTQLKDILRYYQRTAK